MSATSIRHRHTFSISRLATKPLGALACALLICTQPGTLLAQSERGLVLPNSAHHRWNHWESRLGVVVTNDTLSSAQSAQAAAPVSSGLKVQSAHVLSDYHLGSGFKATVGLVRGATHLPWWQPSDTSMKSGGGLSVQRMDILQNEGLPTYLASDRSRTVPYIGAGYSGNLTDTDGLKAWRFQADLGLISLNANNASHLGRVFSGEQGLDELIRELRLRPVVKFTINYKF